MVPGIAKPEQAGEAGPWTAQRAVPVGRVVLWTVLAVLAGPEAREAGLPSL